jgi:YHS domain-containing protein
MRVLVLALALVFPACMAEEKPEPEQQRAGAAASGVKANSVAVAPASACGDKAAGSCCGGGGADKAAGASCGCQGNQAAHAGALVPAHEAKVGDRTTCVVSGGKFVVRTDTMFVSHAGKNYPVCCPGCAARFRQNPQQFLES